MTGGNNPKTNEGGKDYMGYLPFQTNSENYSRRHDERYNRGGAAGVKGALTDVNVGIADIKLAASNAVNVFNPNPGISGRERAQSAAVAVAFGVISAFKIVASPILGPYTLYRKENGK